MQSPWAGYQVVTCDLVLRSCTYWAHRSKSKDLLSVWAGRGALEQRQNPTPCLGGLGGESWELCPCHQQGHRDMGVLAAFKWVCLDLVCDNPVTGQLPLQKVSCSVRDQNRALWAVGGRIQGITAPGRSGDAAYLECSCCEAIHIPS